MGLAIIAGMPIMVVSTLSMPDACWSEAKIPLHREYQMPVDFSLYNPGIYRDMFDEPPRLRTIFR